MELWIMNQDGSASRQVTKESEAKLADIVVLNSDPLQDLHNTTDIKYVMINGFLYDASSMNQIWPEQVPLGEFFWQRNAADAMTAPRP
ncbi:MAG: hypothetical protein V3U86_09430 [Acidobacteriota bacterium]